MVFSVRFVINTITIYILPIKVMSARYYIEMITTQGDFNCGTSSQADSILNYFLSNFLKFPQFPLKFSISSQPGWQAGQIKVTLQITNQQGHQEIFLCYARISVISKLQISKIRHDIYLCHARITVITQLQITNHIQQGHIQVFLYARIAVIAKLQIRKMTKRSFWLLTAP